MKCTHSDKCEWSKCPHFKDHKELFNILDESLCKEGKCHLLEIIVKCT